MNNMLNNKRGVAYIWIYGLAFLFVLGLLYVIFLYVFEGHLVPIVNSTAHSVLANDPTAIATIEAGIVKYMTFFKIMPFVLFFIVVIYMIASTLYKQSSGGY